jgi:hypothetical protein
MTEAETVRCTFCGKFIPYSDMTSGAARFHFEPSSHFGPERTEWSCKDCSDPVESYKRATQGA